MTREVLPNRRAAQVFGLDHGGIEFTVTVGCYADGRVGEIFISTTKAGSDVAHMARDQAILMSFALQSGATVDRLAAGVTRNPDGEPAHLAGIVLDAVHALAYPARPGDDTTAPLADETEAGEAPLPAPLSSAPQPIGFLAGPRPSGDVCTSCGAAAMVRTGTCLTCQACGTSSGGCS